MTHRKWIRGQHWAALASAALFSISSREFCCRTRYCVLCNIMYARTRVMRDCGAGGCGHGPRAVAERLVDYATAFVVIYTVTTPASRLSRPLLSETLSGRRSRFPDKRSHSTRERARRILQSVVLSSKNAPLSSKLSQDESSIRFTLSTGKSGGEGYAWHGPQWTKAEPINSSREGLCDNEAI